jgi:hypothetical protein
MRCNAIWAAALTFAWVNTCLGAEDQPASPRRSDHYFVSAGKTYNSHAHDHVRMLGKYAAAAEHPVPKGVVQEHSTAIKSNVERARSSYARLAQAARQNPSVNKQLADIQERLAQVTAKLAKLEKASDADNVEARLVIDEARAMAKELKAAHQASKQIDQALTSALENKDSFDDPQSPDYYFTGEGHFID